VGWVYLITAGFLEIGFALSLKESHGFTRLWPSIGVLIVGGLSFFLLTLALRSLPIGSAYAVWTGIGAAGTAVVGMLLFGESGNALKLLSITAIVTGVIGLRLTGGE
jgi:quaternary ammonium compound-resistance protein SugE